MLNHILVPLDGSLLAEKALAQALRIVSPTGHITLVMVVDVPKLPIYGYDLMTPSSPWTTEGSVNEIVGRSRSYLEGIADTCRTEDLHVSVLVEYGDPTTALTTVARERKVDAIVMSTHGRSGLQRWLFGSVTRRVLETAPCPVYVIPAHDGAAASATAQAEPKVARAG